MQVNLHICAVSHTLCAMLLPLLPLRQVVSGELGNSHVSHKLKQQLGLAQAAVEQLDEWRAEDARPVDAAVEYALAAPAVAKQAAEAAAAQPAAKRRKK